MSRVSAVLLLCWLLCWLLCLAPPLAAAEAVSTFTERAFVEAVLGNPAVEAMLVGERELARAETLRVALLPNPALEASREEPGAVAETTVTLRWALPRPDRRLLARGLAAKGLEGAEARLEAARLALRLELRAAFGGWALAWQRRELLAGQVARVVKLAEKQRWRAEAGEIAGLAARRLALEAAQAHSELAGAEAELAVARAAVAAWLPALPPEARPLLPALPPPPPVLPDLAERADLIARQRELERAEAQVRLSRKVLEAPSLELGWKRIEERDESASGAVVALGWTLPLFDRHQAEGLEAGARLAAARAAVELGRRRALAERDGALAAYRGLYSENQRVSQATAELETLTAGAEAAYGAGEADLTDLLDTLRATFAARLAALETREAALAAARALEAALGSTLTADLGDSP